MIKKIENVQKCSKNRKVLFTFTAALILILKNVAILLSDKELTVAAILARPIRKEKQRKILFYLAARMSKPTRSACS